MIIGLIFSLNERKRIDSDELNKNKKKRIAYLTLVAVQLGLICGFRSTVMAYDTGTYKQIFDMAPDSWAHIFDKSSYAEAGFRILCSLIKIFGGGFQTMLVITSMFVMGSCCVFIYRHSKDVVLSVFIIISFPFYYSSFDIIRHFIVTAFFLLGYKYIEERKLVKYVVFILIGSLFHSVAVIFLPFYFAKKIKWSWKTMLVAITGTVAVYFLIEPIAILAGKLLGKSNGIASGWIASYGGGEKTAVMYAFVFLIAAMAYYLLKAPTEDDMNAVNYVLLMLVFSILFINARMMTRMIMTTVALVAIAIPQLLDKSRTRSLNDYVLLKLAFLGIGSAYHAFMLFTNWQHVVPYVPFWS
jgi:hypothetical protein